MGRSGGGADPGPLDRSQYHAGLEFRLPLPNRDAGGDAKAKEAAFAAARSRRSETVLAVANARRSFSSSLPRLREALGISRLSVRTASLRLGAVLEKYGQGRAELFHVIDARDTLAAARIGELEAEAVLARLVLEELALSDRLLPFFGIAEHPAASR
jgi:outer membrane protein TolC